MNAVFPTDDPFQVELRENQLKTNFYHLKKVVAARDASFTEGGRKADWITFWEVGLFLGTHSLFWYLLSKSQTTARSSTAP